MGSSGGTPSTQMGTPKWGTPKGRGGTPKMVKKKVLRMKFSIVEILSGLQESIFSLSRRPQLHFGKKSKIERFYINFADFPVFSY